jgi:hypothetical protein
MNNKYYTPADIFNRVYSGTTLKGVYDNEADILNAVFVEGQDALNVNMTVDIVDAEIDNLTVNGTLTVIGDMVVSGTSYSVISEDVLVTETHLTLNYGEIGSGVTNRTAGLIIDRGLALDYLIEYDELDDSLKAGFSGSTKKLVFIDDIVTTTGITSLSTAIAQETIQRVSGDTSLSTAISSISLTPGPQGIQGIQGVQGETGIQGISGYTGVDGVQGIQGLQGLSGYTGVDGVQGIQGISGDTGLQGIQGIQGETGIQGLQGISGDTGLQGIQGIQGIQGETGIQGLTGIQGVQGIQGLIDPTLSTALSNEVTKTTNVYVDSLNYNGFPNRTDSTLSFDNNRTFTITGTFNIYLNGVKTPKTTESIQLPSGTTGLYWIWYDLSTGVLTSGLTGQKFSDCLVANIYYNTILNQGILSDERHHFGRDHSIHEMLHETVGARYYNGGTIVPANSSFSITQAEIYDEDIEHILPSGVTCKVMYLSGSADWLFSTGSTTLYYLSGTSMTYLNGTTLSVVPVNNYSCYWVYATNNTTYPFMIITSQYVNSNISTTRTNSVPPTLGNLPSAEMKLFYRVMYRQVGTTPTYVETADYRTSSTLANSGTYVPSDHLLLTNIGTLTHLELESSLSTEISSRISSDASLLSLIPTGSTSFTGGTVYDLTVSNNLSVNGYTIAKKTSKISSLLYPKMDFAGYPAFGGGGNVLFNASSFSNGVLLAYETSADFVVLYDDNNLVAKYGSGQFTTTGGLITCTRDRVTKISNGRVDWYNIVNGYVDTTSYSGYTTGNPKFVQNCANNFTTNSYKSRHKEVGNSGYIFQISSNSILRYYWDSGRTIFTINFVGSGNTYGTYLSGTDEICRVASGNTMNVYTNGSLTSTSGLTTNWIGAGHTSVTNKFFEEDSKYIVYGYQYGSNMFMTTYDKVANTYTNATYGSGVLIEDLPNTLLYDNNFYGWHNTTFVKVYINPITKAYTYSSPFGILTLESDTIEHKGSIFFTSSYVSDATSPIKKYTPGNDNTTFNNGTVEPDSFQLISWNDARSLDTILSTATSTALSTMTVSVNLALGKASEYTVTQIPNNITAGGYPYGLYFISDDGLYRVNWNSPTYIQDTDTGANFRAFNKTCGDALWVNGSDKLYIMHTTSAVNGRNLNLSGITKCVLTGTTYDFIETGITFANILFNHRDKLITYRDVTNGLLKVYNCYTDTVIKSVSSGTSFTWIGAVSPTQYWLKTTGTTIQIKNISDDSLVKSTTITPTWRTYNMMYNEYNGCIYAGDDDVSLTYSINIWTGKGFAVSANAYHQCYYTENYIYVGQNSNVSDIWVLNKFNKQVGTIYQYGNRQGAFSSGKYFTYFDSADGNKLKIIY